MTEPVTHTGQRLHIPSGRQSEFNFNGTHSYLFHEPFLYPERVLMAKKLELMNAWNRQQPTEWKYWI